MSKSLRVIYEPYVSVVVPVLNGENVISECIKSLLNLNYPEDKYEIIIVDNNSIDRTADIIKKYPVRYIKEINKGAGIARNSGYKNAKNDLIAFTDSDCIAHEDWLRNIVKHFKNSKVGGCGGKIDFYYSKSYLDKYYIHKKIISQESAFIKKKDSLPFIITANAAYRKSTLNAVDGFNIFFSDKAGEDADLSWRVCWKNYKIKYEPNAVVYHKHRSTLKEMLKQVNYYGAGSSYLFWYHRKKYGLKNLINIKDYYKILETFIKIPFCLIFKKDDFQKILPCYEFLTLISFLSGKIITSLKLGIIYF